MTSWRIEVLTSLYPAPSRPYEGVFAERRWRGMRERGHDVHVTHPLPRTPGPFAFGRWAEIRSMPRSELRNGVPVERPRYFHVKGRAGASARRFARTGARSILARGRPDVMVADYAWPAAAAVPLFREAGVPCLVSGRGSDVLQVAAIDGLRDELARALALAEHWCAVSEDLVRAMDDIGGVAGRGVLVPNGVDLELFRPHDRASARGALDLPGEPRLVLVAGHLIERKDPLLALEVFSRGAPADAHCAFVGRGPLEGALRARAAELGIAARVLFTGEVPPERLAAWYAAADLLLLTSRREGRPNVVLEALASGRPVLATESGGTGELLRGLDGRQLSASRDPEVLGRRLAELLERPPAEAEQRAAAEPFSWERSLGALEACLGGVIAAHARLGA